MFRLFQICAGTALGLSLICGSLPAVSPARGMFRHASLKDAWQASRESRRPIFVFVTMDGCHYCNKMQGVTFTEPGVSRLLKNKFEPVVVDQSSDAALVEKLQVERFPTTILAMPDGTIVERMEGFVSPEQLQRRLVDRQLHPLR